MDQEKQLNGLVTGLTRRMFFNDDDITDEILKEKLFAGAEASFDSVSQRVTKMLNAVSAADMEPAQAERYLDAQGKKKDGVTEAEQAAIMKFWKKERGRVHDVLVKRACWNDGLASMSWRVDVLTSSQHVDELNSPAAIMEFKVDKGDDETQEVVRFEMGVKQVEDMLQQVDDIEKQIKTLTS
eukprot:m.8954 g.8954  ORF g.8954 m.8954 type:complete len:183 (-) comp6784_c0_seq1:64-612(-)